MTDWSDSAYEAGPPCKKRKLKATTNIETLPDDITFEILVRVPAQDIFDSTRLVCRKWCKMIRTRNFVHSHLQRSTPGLLGVWQRTFITMQNDQIEISKLSYRFKGTILSGCNGLLLELRENLPEPYIIMNPVTKQRLTLPPFRKSYNRFAIAYAASSRAYKVVRAFHSNRNKLGCISIMTIGVDTDWGRRVSTRHLSNTAKELLREEFPLTTQGFVHWAKNGWAQKSNIDCVLTMNVESEIITQIPGPCLCLDGKVLRYCYLPMGSYLSLLIARSRFLWEAWKMKPETGEWTKMHSIDMEPRKMFEHLSSRLKLTVSGRWLKPVGWSNSQDVLFFGISNTVFPVFAAYNVRTREICSLDELDSMETLFVDYRSSLVRLD